MHNKSRKDKKEIVKQYLLASMAIGWFLGIISTVIFLIISEPYWINL